MWAMRLYIDKTVIKYMNGHILLCESLTEPDLASFSAIDCDEVHEQTISTDILLQSKHSICGGDSDKLYNFY